MNSIIKKLTLIFILNLSFTLNAQPVNISNFFVYKTDKQALLHWVIDSGSTCIGVSIFRSTNNTDFIEIGHIAGICGNSSSSTNYNFTDESPNIYGANYYKLRFGTFQFSEVQFLDFNYIDSKTIKIKPNPASETLNVEFKNDKNELYTLKIISSSGTNVYQNYSVITSQLSINVANLTLGKYYLQLDDNKGKLITQQFIISK